MLFILPLLAPLVLGHETMNPIVDLSYAKYQGYYDASTGINYFRGIPYAQPPVNELRWHKPRPIEDDLRVRGKTLRATEVGPMCYQGLPVALAGSTALDGNQSEDCLILDVLVPAKPASTALPVLVQIHGGGFTLGSAQVAPGDALVHKSQGTE